MKMHVMTNKDCSDAPRLAYVDALKGFAIILVVIGHLYIYRVRPLEHFTLPTVIYSFHMPLFMMLCGLVGRMVIADGWSFAFKRTVSLMVPYLFVSSMYGLMMSGGELSSLWQMKYKSEFWFLLTLFLIHMVVLAVNLFLWCLIKKGRLNEWHVVTAFILFACGIHLVIKEWFSWVNSVQSLPYYMAWFCAGWVYRRLTDYYVKWLCHPIFLITMAASYVVCYKVIRGRLSENSQSIAP